MGDATPPSLKKELKLINLLKGWPNPSLLPTKAIAHASQTALSTPSISIPALCYGPDPGYQPLREEIAKWLSTFYSSPDTNPNPTLPLQPSSQGTSTKTSPPIQLGTGESNFVAKDDPAERICITGGASQNLACVLQVYSDPVRTKVWMVAPCYFLACRIFEDAGLTCGAVPEMGEGGEVDLVWLEKELRGKGEEREKKKPIKSPKPWSKFYSHIIYLVPTFSNPSGKTMSLSHRKALILLARKYDALIVTDDVYDFLQWPTASPIPSTPATAPVPRLVDIDRTLEPVPDVNSFGNAVSNGSFSKIVGPGVRTGWAEATPKFTHGLSQCGSSRSGGAPSQLVATMIAEMLRTNTLQSHIQNTLIPAYQKRYSVLIEAVRKVLLPLGVKLGETEFGEEEIFGGYFVWLDLPEDVSANLVSKRAREEWRLVVSPGEAFEVTGDERVKFKSQLRICFAWEEELELVTGIERLGGVIQAVLSGKAEKRGGNITRKEEWKQDLGEFQ